MANKSKKHKEPVYLDPDTNIRRRLIEQTRTADYHMMTRVKDGYRSYFRPEVFSKMVLQT